MDEHEWLAQQLEANQSHLQAVAYRMLGSLSEAEDAVQDFWLLSSYYAPWHFLYFLPLPQ